MARTRCYRAGVLSDEDFDQNVPYPGFSKHSGFYVSSVVIIAFSASLYLLFKRKAWL